MILFCYAGKGNLHNGRTLIIPDDYSSGVMYFQEEGRMDELMEFLAGFVRLVHAD
jgi:hypothetical protein